MPTSTSKKLDLPDEETIERLQSDKELVHVLGLLGIDITGRVIGDVKENMKVLNHARVRCYDDLFLRFHTLEMTFSLTTPDLIPTKLKRQHSVFKLPRSFTWLTLTMPLLRL